MRNFKIEVPYEIQLFLIPSNFLCMKEIKNGKTKISKSK